MTSQEPSSKLWKYDVFLSFRGEDTRNGFTGHLLHVALKDRGYEVFIDDGLKRGKQIREELFQAIEDSRISIIVFSKRYADSSWCLDELVKIMECREKLERVVLPIFYDVEPSLVRKQEGYLAEAFQKHEDSIREERKDKEREAKEERVQQWRRALTQAAELSGHHLQNGQVDVEKDYVTKILDGCGSSPIIGISVLCERCLVTVERGMLMVHDLIREMCKIIISEKSPTQPERWSRLWDLEALTDVLTNKSGTQEIEGITLDLPCSKKASFSTKAFANMKNLRFLQLINVKLTGKFKHFPKELRWLRWRGFLSSPCPSTFLMNQNLLLFTCPTANSHDAGRFPSASKI